MIVVSDTTPIISLMKAGQLELLRQLFGVVYIPEAVYRELTDNEAFSEEEKRYRSVNSFMCRKRTMGSQLPYCRILPD